MIRWTDMVACPAGSYQRTHPSVRESRNTLLRSEPEGGEFVSQTKRMSSHRIAGRLALATAIAAASALAVTSLERNPAYPNVPSVKEILGNDNVESTSYWGIIAPKGTPKPIVDRYHKEIVRILRSPEVTQQLEKMEFEVVAGTPEQFSSWIAAEIPRWGKVIKANNIKVD